LLLDGFVCKLWVEPYERLLSRGKCIMPSRDLAFPVFDADNHMYETPNAFTKYLPSAYEGFIKFVEVEGRTKIAVNNKISDYIPNPTFEVVATPGAQEKYFKEGNPEGKTPRDYGQGHPGAARLQRARATAQAPR
jgi:hypothetical protein